MDNSLKLVSSNSHTRTNDVDLGPKPSSGLDPIPIGLEAI